MTITALAAPPACASPRRSPGQAPSPHAFDSALATAVSQIAPSTEPAPARPTGDHLSAAPALAGPALADGMPAGQGFDGSVTLGSVAVSPAILMPAGPGLSLFRVGIAAPALASDAAPGSIATGEAAPVEAPAAVSGTALSSTALSSTAQPVPPASAATVPTGVVPAGPLPTAPVPSAPVPNAPVPAGSLPTAPLPAVAGSPAAPVPAAPVPADSAPADSAPADSAPAETVPVGPVLSTAAPLVPVPVATSTAAASVPAPPVPAPVPTPVAAQLAGPIFTLAAAGKGEHLMTVTVAPDNLGPVTVRAQVSADGVRVELFALTDPSRDALRSILTDLRRDLQSLGLNATLDLSARDAPDPRDRNEGRGAGRHGTDDRDGAEERGLALGSDQGAPPGESDMRFPFWGSRSTIDILA